jgi:hypothetical protein
MFRIFFWWVILPNILGMIRMDEMDILILYQPFGSSNGVVSDKLLTCSDPCPSTANSEVSQKGISAGMFPFTSEGR